MTSLADIINSSTFETATHLLFLLGGVLMGFTLKSVLFIVVFFSLCLGFAYLMPLGTVHFSEVAKLFGLAAVGALAVPAVESMMGFR